MLSQLLRSLFTVGSLLTVVTLGSAQLIEPVTPPENGLPLQPGYAGTEFWFSMPSNWNIPSATSNYIRLYLFSAETTSVRVEMGSAVIQTLDLLPFTLTTCDLTPEQAQPIVRRDVDPVPVDSLYAQKGIHMIADAPFVAYAMNRTSYTSDGMILLPLSALGSQYVVSSYASVTDGSVQNLPSQYLVVAPHDSTVVTVTNAMATQGHTAGERFTVVMNSGDVYSGMSIGAKGDVTGVQVDASKPIYVVGGQNCTYIPNIQTYCCCDHLTETMMPTAAWGTIYHAVPFATRVKGDFYRIMTRDSGTTLYVNDSLIGVLPGGGNLQGERWLEYRSPDKRLIEFRADKPISVAQYNTSAAYDGVPSDPFFLTLLPAEQYMRSVAFTTPGADFASNFVNLVCDSATWDSMEIAVGASATWSRLRDYAGTTGQVRIFPTTHQATTLMGTTITITPGTYRIRSPRPFTGYLYGFSPSDSYGYPLAAITVQGGTVDSLPPVMEIVADQCGQAFDATVDSRNSGVSLSDIRITQYENFEESLGAFLPGSSASTTMHLSVLDPRKNAVGTVVAVDMAGNTTAYRISSSGVAVKCPSEVMFDTIPTGNVSEEQIAVHNSSSRPVVIRSIKLRPGSPFQVLTPAFPVTINRGDSIELELSFQPGVNGDAIDTLILNEECVDALETVVLRGTGSGPSSVNEAPVSTSRDPAVSIITTSGQRTLHIVAGRSSHVGIDVVDIAGRRLMSVAEDCELRPGTTDIPLPIGDLPAILWFVRLTTSNGVVLVR